MSSSTHRAQHGVTLIIAVEPRRKDRKMFASKMSAPPFAKKSKKGPPKDEGDDDALFGDGGDAPEGSDEEEAGESPDEEASESSDALAEVSDDDLIAEVRKRKLKL
jgi:hypothetical protein